MICPKCNKPALEVTNSYPTGTKGKIQRCVCSLCSAVVTVQITVEVIEIDPPYGRGAASIAKKLNGAKKTRPLGSSLEGQRASVSDPGGWADNRGLIPANAGRASAAQPSSPESRYPANSTEPVA